MNTAPGLKIENLDAGYGALHVVNDISLHVRPGERLGIVGLNGHGKSTLLNALFGLAGWRRGSAELDGVDLMSMATHQLSRAGLVLAPQGDALFPGLTVEENVISGAFPNPLWRSRKPALDHVFDVFPRLGERRKQLVGTLSGGERRMCSIGRALMGRARYLMIDEPSLGLAPNVSEAIMQTLSELDRSDGALLLVEQDRGLLAGRVDRIVTIHAGRLIPEVNPSDSSEALGAVQP